jgi:hypothetical protein
MNTVTSGDTDLIGDLESYIMNTSNSREHLILSAIHNLMILNGSNFR